MRALRQPTLVIMVKEPRAGRVKTRLGRDIGMTQAAWWYRHQVVRTLRTLRDPRWALTLAITPDRSLPSRTWPADLPRMSQGKGDLGRRMTRCLMATQGPTILIGSDIPGVKPRHIADAFQLLGRNESVVGPATDGGFWLIGLRHPARAPRTLFENVIWSDPKTLEQTLTTLPGAYGVAPTLCDVDTLADLQASSF